MSENLGPGKADFFQQIWEYFPNPVMLLDDQGKVTLTNKVMAKTLGFEVSELQGVWLKEVSHPDEFDRDFREFSRFFKEEAQAYSVEKRHRRSDGHYLWFYANAQAVRNEFGKVTHVIVSYNDISHKKSMEDSILAQYQGQLSILNSSSYAIIGTDMDGLVTSFNPAAERMLGYTATETVQCSNFSVFLDLFESFKHVQSLSEEFQKNVEVGFPALVEKTKMYGGDESQWTLLDKNRHRHTVSLSISPMINIWGSQEGFLFLARDVSIQKAMQEKLEEQRVNLIHASRLASLGEMAAGVAHEINNPLAIIIGKSDRILNLLKQNNVDVSKLNQEVDKIKATAHRIAKIIIGLRTFSRSGENEPFQLFNCATVVEETLDLCAEKFKNNSIHIECQVAPGCLIEGRSAQISQVLLNLLNNAFDAVQSQQDKWVKVVVCSFESTIEISVTDSGWGISESIAQRIMQPFFTTKEIGKGTGLGLSISQGIISSHKGRLYLDLESEHTNFIIELPRAKILTESSTSLEPKKAG